MLKYKINKLGLTESYNAIETYDFMVSDSLVFSYNSTHKINVDSQMLFSRSDGNDLSFSDGVVILSAKTNAVTAMTLPDVRLTIRNIQPVDINGEEYSLITFNERHYADSNRSEDTIGDSWESVCPGDYFISSDYLIYKKEEDRYIFSNILCQFFWVDTYGTTHFAEGTVPCTLSERDLKTSLLVKASEFNELTDYTYCFVKDMRFFSYEVVGDGVWAAELKPNAFILLKMGTPVLSIPIEHTFSTDLMALDGVEQYLEEEASKKVNKPLDYEKQQFIPVIRPVNTDKYVEMSDIMFCIHVRQRGGDEWEIIKDTNNPWGERNLILLSSPVESLGFKWQDIYYQKKCVSETFLRLSFYDNPSRGKQQLLYTAKIYLDENRLWTKYVNEEEKDLKHISCYFKTSNKYDYNNPTEGFYLHLFPGNLMENTEEDFYIYMKAEFFNAKYGAIVPLVTDNKNPGEQISPGLAKGTYVYSTYISHSGGNEVHTNMQRLNTDMYIPIKIRYDAENHRYQWVLPKKLENNEFHLYEPVVS